jgi:hypothetical protein
MMLCLLLAKLAWAQSSASGNATKTSLHQQHNLMGESVGLAGYDPVAYFPEGGGKPARGLISISHQYEGVTYRFNSEI